MPTYIWRCEKCGKEQQVIKSVRKFHETPEACDSGCSEPKWKRLIGLTNFALKGDGWAKDGYSK